MNVLPCAQPRRRSVYSCNEPSQTDQSFKRSCDINHIMEQYRKTGMFPNFRTREPRYIDNTSIPPFLEAFEMVNTARELFYDLPAPVRKLMDNDPSQLEIFIKDPANQDILLKHGVLEARKEPPKDDTLTATRFHETIEKVFKTKDKN